MYGTTIWFETHTGCMSVISGLAHYGISNSSALHIIDKFFFSKCFNECIKWNKVESLNYGFSKGQTNVYFTNQQTMQNKFIITVSDAKDNDLNDTASGFRLTCN